jgi:hypothetical protein
MYGIGRENANFHIHGNFHSLQILVTLYDNMTVNFSIAVTCQLLAETA